MPLEEFIIAVFCCRESILQEIMTEYPLRQRGFSPKLSDREVLTMERVGEFLGRDMEKHIWQFHYRALFYAIMKWSFKRLTHRILHVERETHFEGADDE